MSLLEDIFLADEANEAQELERVIEGDEYDERPRSDDESDDNGNREDEAEEDKRRVDPTSTKTKRVTKNPRFILNPARLTGPRGIQVIPEHFKDFKFKGKGHEKEDIDLVLKKLEHWAYRLYPKFQFADCLKKIETLGKKRPVMVHLHKIRTDQFMSEETVVQKDSSDDEAQPPQEEDEFDKLLQQQIDMARATPAPGSVKKVIDRSDQWARIMETPNRDERSLLPMPKATSSPSISDEQKERMIRNRKLAEERRLARLKQTNSATNNINNTPPTIIEMDENEVAKDTNDDREIVDMQKVIHKKKHNNVIDSSDSDEECNVAANESVVVQVHNGSNIQETSDEKKIDDQAKISNGIDEITVDQSAEKDDMNDNREDITAHKNHNDVLNAINSDENNLIGIVSDSHEQNIKENHVNSELINAHTDIQSNNLLTINDNEINTEARQNSRKPNVTVAEEVTEEIMDVDFADDF